METLSNTIEDKLIDGLSYKLDATASYITERKSSTFWATGSNQYSPTGVKVIKLLLSGDNWLDPSTVKVMFDLVNLDSDELRPLSGPWSFFRRMRVLCNGALIEDIDYYNHVYQMFHTLQARHVRDNEDLEGFEVRYDSPYTVDLISPPNTAVGVFPFINHYLGVRPVSSKTVSFSLLSGILNQPKMLPLKFLPITIELELVNNLYDPIISGSLYSTSANYNDRLGSGQSNALAPGGYSPFASHWQIQNVQVKCDIVRLDNAVENMYYSKFLSGESIPINYSTYISQLQAVSGSNTSVNVTRSVSRLKSVFLTFAPNSNFASNVYPISAEVNATDPYLNNPWAFLHDFNDFYHPMLEAGRYQASYDQEVQLQIGSKLFPEYPMKSLAEQFANLRKCLGIQQSQFHSLDITPQEYRSHKHIIGIDTEKILSASFSGENLKQGSLITVKIKQGPEVSTNAYPVGVYVIMHADYVLNIRNSGVEIWD